MKFAIFFAISVFSLNVFARSPIDIPPDASFKTYQRLQRQLQWQKNPLFSMQDQQDQALPTDPLERAIALGARSFAWIETLNKSRPPERRLLVSSVANKGGIPIEKPQTYSPKIVAEKLATWEAEAPAEIRDVLITRAKPYTTEFTIDETQFLKIHRAIRVLYSTAVRWNSMQPYLPYLRQARVNDVRGYYFLSKEPNLQNDLANFAQLESAKQDTWRKYLEGMCFNNETPADQCSNEIKAAEASGTLGAAYARWEPKSKEIWDGMFQLQWRGTDIGWSDSAKTRLDSGVRSTADAKLETFFHDILARVWNVGGALLSANFGPDARLTIEFAPGAQTHYEYSGKIVMDQRDDLADPENQITLAHEFGHALGFPDCYVEFYLEEEQAIMDYQLDVENIMCSLNGHVNDGHFAELRKGYSSTSVAQ